MLQTGCITAHMPRSKGTCSRYLYLYLVPLSLFDTDMRAARQVTPYHSLTSAGGPLLPELRFIIEWEQVPALPFWYMLCHTPGHTNVRTRRYLLLIFCLFAG